MVLQHLHYNVNIMVTILKTFSFLQLQRASNWLYFVLRKHTGNFFLPSYSLGGVTEGIFILRNTLESLCHKSGSRKRASSLSLLGFSNGKSVVTNMKTFFVEFCMTDRWNITRWNKPWKVVSILLDVKSIKTIKNKLMLLRTKDWRH